MRAHLLQVVGVGAGQEVLRAPADEVVQRDQQVLEVVNGPLVEALDELRPQAPHLLADLRAPTAVLSYVPGGP